MRSLAILLGCLSAVDALAADGIVVWMEPAVPGEKALQRAENVAGPTSHLSHLDLAFPPQPASDEDTKDYVQLRDVVAASRAKWEEFEVELGIATDLEAAFQKIDVVRDERDADQIVVARALQGAAAFRAFDPNDFGQSERAAPFRIVFPGTDPLIRPWVEALALDPDHKLGQDVAESSTWPDLQKLQEAVGLLSDGWIDVSALPAGASLVVDGKAVTPSDAKVPLRPGNHYVHVLKQGVISGRSRIEITPGDTIPVPMVVSADELGAARAQVVEGTTTGFPDDVKSALEQIAAHYQGPIFVGAVEEGRAVVLPYARGATLLKSTPVTFNLVGDIGPEVVISSLFDESEGELTTAPGASGSLGMEFGIYNAVILGAMDIAFTPTETVTWANSENTENVSGSALPQPWGGIGLYVLRPVGASPYLLLAGTYGFNGPAHMAPGGRLTVGLPLKDEKSWIRITLGGTTSKDMMEDWRPVIGRVTPMHTGFLRVGLATGF
jgi:hypothetical protein